MHDLPVLRTYLDNGKDATEVTDCSDRVRKPMQVATGQKVAGRRPEGGREPLTGRTAVVVDDGIATGSTARAACQVARAHGAARVVLAVPVAPRGWEARIAAAADELVCVDARTRDGRRSGETGCR